LLALLEPLASRTVTAIVGFTELAPGGLLYNSAAVLHEGAIAGIYRKHHPAIRRSVYQAGSEAPVFRIGGLVFGIVICNDSNFPEPAANMASQGAKVLFVPSNNALPLARASVDLIAASRDADRARAIGNRMWVVRADVAGRTGGLVSYGSSGVVNPDGEIVASAPMLAEHLLIVDLGDSGYPENHASPRGR